MARRRRGRAVDGILVLDKPQGLSSNQALQRAKRLFDAAKAGHTGSLDPLATGVLPLCFGEATKVSQFLLDADKEYQSTFILGVATNTADAEGEVTASAPAGAVEAGVLEAAMVSLRGEIEQIPPAFSAIKVDGQPLYKRARAGEVVEVPPRRVTIHSLTLEAFRPGVVAEADLTIRCSKGTYIRSLAVDLGQALGLPAHVGALRRTRAGPFALEQSVTLAQLEALASSESVLDGLLVSPELAIDHLPRLQVGETAGYYLRNGQPVRVPNAPRSGMVRIVGAGGDFLGVGEMLEDGRVAPRRLIAN